MQNFLLAALMCGFLASAQNTQNVFDIARTGSADQARQLVATSPGAFNATDERGFSPLILASYRGNIEVVRVLTQHKIDLDRMSPMGTALMAATFKGHNEVAKLLLQHGADPNLADDNGTTALMYAVQFRNVEMVNALLNAKADKTKADKKGKTAFEFAVFGGNDEIINLLK